MKAKIGLQCGKPEWKCACLNLFGERQWCGTTRSGINIPAPVTVPPPLDYATPAAVTARAREAGGWTRTRTDKLRHVGQWWDKPREQRAFAKLYREFRKAVRTPAPCPVEDTHTPTWEYRRVGDIYQCRPLGVKPSTRWIPCDMEDRQ